MGLEAAAWELKGPAAPPAEEVVVVPGACRLVPQGLPRQGHGHHGALLHQGPQVAVDRGQAQGGDLLAGELQDLPRGEGAPGLQEDPADGAALAGGPLHAFSLPQAITRFHLLPVE